MNQLDPCSEEFWASPRLEEYPQLQLLLTFVQRTLTENWYKPQWSEWAPGARAIMLEGVAPISMHVLCKKFTPIGAAAMAALEYPKGYVEEGLPARARVQWKLVSQKYK